MKKIYLLTPGPTPVPEGVLLAGARPVMHHRTAEFGELLLEVEEGLKSVFQTKSDVYLFASSGTGAMEAAVANLLSRGDRALVVDIGAFGRRWTNILKAFGIEPEVLQYEWGKVARIEDIEKKLKEVPDIKAVFAQHTETSTGVVNDIEGMAKVIRKSQAVLVVDAVSGLGAQELKMDDWGVDVVVSGSQKGLMLPPGLAFLSISERAWPLVETSTLPKFYWDIKAYRKNLKDKQMPYTPPVNLLFSLKEAINLIKQEGLANVLARHAELAEATRKGVRAIGLELFAERPCNAVTSVKVPGSIDGKELVKRMRLELGVGIAGGQREYKGKIFRIAHLGYMGKFDVIIALSGLEIMLTQMGHPVELGKAVSTAEKEFLKKS